MEHASLEVAARRRVAVRAAAVLSPDAYDVDAMADVLFRSGTDSSGRSGRPLTVDLSVWADGCLDRDDAIKVRRVAQRAALPAQTAAVVAVRCARDARLTKGELDDCALLVAGNNLALAYEAETVLAHATGTARVRPSHAVTHLDIDAVGVVSEILDIHGEGWAVGAASASSAVAVIQAMRLLQSGEIRRCLVVAPASELSAVEMRALRDSGAMCDDNASADLPPLCRPFDQARSGFVFGQAAAAVLLELDSDAVPPPLALLLGSGLRLDGRRGTTPSAEGQEEAMRRALRQAGVSPEEIGYVNAHATGSLVGDPCEARALANVFGDGRQPLVNSSKAILGHGLSAAGLVELIATIEQLRRRLAHDNPNTTDPIAEIGDHLVGSVPAPIARPVALKNSFAFSGINASLVISTSILEES
jgi:malonyl-ACP decarboxylase